MTSKTHHEWRIAAHPDGRALQASDFELATSPTPEPGPGEVMVATQYLSFEPALKSWMERAAGYMSPVKIGDLIRGPGAGVVTASRHPGFAPGDLVYGQLGWRELAAVPGEDLEKAPEGVPLDAVLSVMASSGRTAYLALTRIGRPVAGDTLVISGAAGAVGSLVGQIGKIAGCRVIGIAGGAEKCAWLTDKLGFDGAIDYKGEKVRARLRELCPDGVDIFFDNVGGEILNDALARLALRARVVICGAISRYNFDPRSEAMPPGPRNYFNVVFTGASIQGFLADHYKGDFAEADARLAAWIRDGRIAAHADLLHGFENAPSALMRLFEGRNFGKQLLKLTEA
jgi:NADPH-dependent curcumin reductase CurA